MTTAAISWPRYHWHEQQARKAADAVRMAEAKAERYGVDLWSGNETQPLVWWHTRAMEDMVYHADCAEQIAALLTPNDADDAETDDDSELPLMHWRW